MLPCRLLLTDLCEQDKLWQIPYTSVDVYESQSLHNEVSKRLHKKTHGQYGHASFDVKINISQLNPALADMGSFFHSPSGIFKITPTFLELATRNVAYLILH